MNDLELVKKKNEELKKMRKNSKMFVNWWEDFVEEFDLVYVKEFKSLLEKLKSYVIEEVFKYF